MPDNSQISIRGLPVEVHRALRVRAAQEMISLNAFIVRALTAVVGKAEPLAGAPKRKGPTS